jgi:hypothetical protein
VFKRKYDPLGVFYRPTCVGMGTLGGEKDNHARKEADGADWEAGRLGRILGSGF